MTNDHPEKKRPERKRRISLPGQVIALNLNERSQPQDPFEQHYQNVLPSYLKKGWCVFYRNGYIGLTGYKEKKEDYIPLHDRKDPALYKDYIDKDGNKKTKVQVPREERIVSIAYIDSVDKNGNHLAYRWEVRTHWTVQRNLFDNFEPAWKLFHEIEQRYDPGTIVWSKFDEYDEFENY